MIDSRTDSWLKPGQHFRSGDHHDLCAFDYVVHTVEHNCRCAHIIDQINGNEREWPVHSHIAATRSDEPNKLPSVWFNWIDADGICLMTGKRYLYRYDPVPAKGEQMRFDL